MVDTDDRPDDAHAGSAGAIRDRRVTPRGVLPRQCRCG